MRYAARVDANQEGIVKDLRRLGYDVDIVSREKGMYDIVVSGLALWATRTVGVRVEIKVNQKSTMTPDEELYWRLQKNQDNLIRATCTDDILKWFGVV